MIWNWMEITRSSFRTPQDGDSCIVNRKFLDTYCWSTFEVWRYFSLMRQEAWYREIEHPMFWWSEE